MKPRVIVVPDKLPLERYWWLLPVMAWAVGTVAGYLSTAPWSQWLAALLASWVSDRVSLGWRMNRVGLVIGSGLVAGLSVSLVAVPMGSVVGLAVVVLVLVWCRRIGGE